MVLTESEKWLLVIIGSADYIEGKTRLHKYGLLVQTKVQGLGEFYRDWQPNNYGVFSPSLASGLQILESQEYVKSNEITTQSGRSVNRYQITQKGREEITELLGTKQDTVQKISQIVHHYFAKPLNVLLNDVYTLFPEFTTKSRIKSDVNKFRLEQEELFEHELDNFENAEYNLTNLATKKTAEHIYNDEDIREKISKQLGLDSIPHLDIAAFDKLAGLLQDKIKQNEIDSVEAVRTVRGS